MQFTVTKEQLGDLLLMILYRSLRTEMFSTDFYDTVDRVNGLQPQLRKFFLSQSADQRTMIKRLEGVLTGNQSALLHIVQAPKKEVKQAPKVKIPKAKKIKNIVSIASKYL